MGGEGAVTNSLNSVAITPLVLKPPENPDDQFFTSKSDSLKPKTELPSSSSPNLEAYTEFFSLAPRPKISLVGSENVVDTVKVDEAKEEDNAKTAKALEAGIETLTSGNSDVTVGENVQEFVHGKVTTFSKTQPEGEDPAEKIDTWNNWGNDFLSALAKDLKISEKDIKKLSPQDKEALLTKLQLKTKAYWADSSFGPDTLVSFVKKAGVDKFDKRYMADFKSSEWEALSNYYAPAGMKPEAVRRIYSKTTMEIVGVNLDSLTNLVNSLNTTTQPKFAIVDGRTLVAYGELTKEEILEFRKLFTSTELKNAFEQFVQNAIVNSRRPSTPTGAFDEKGNYSPSSPLSAAEIIDGSYSPAQARILGMMIAKVKSAYRQEAIDAIKSRGILPRLEALEKELQKEIPGYKLNIISGYRDFAYNQRVGGATGSKHMDGIAVDVSIPKGIGQEKFIKIATEAVGFTGIGRYSSFTHIDLGPKRQWHG
jgi:uncharacterized protein YcbK (DUF882 family)